MELNYKTAKNKLLASNPEGCRQFFEQNGYNLEAAYCYLLEDDLKNAKELFARSSEKDIRAQWGIFLCGLIEKRVNTYPSYLQLRNFLEIDLNILIRYYKGDYVENIIMYADWLCTINPEVHKYIGRVLLKCGYENEGIYFLKQAENYFYNDPELHYLLAEYYFDKNDRQNTLLYAEKCLGVLPGYFPAINLQRKLKLNCQ